MVKLDSDFKLGIVIILIIAFAAFLWWALIWLLLGGLALIVIVNIICFIGRLGNKWAKKVCNKLTGGNEE